MLTSTVVALASGTPRLWVRTAVLLLMDIAIAVQRQLPLNQKVQSWTDGTIPDDWALVSDRWALHHTVRSVLGVAALACFPAAVLLTIER